MAQFYLIIQTEQTLEDIHTNRIKGWDKISEGGKKGMAE